MISIRRHLNPSDCYLLFAWRLQNDVKRWSLKDPPEWLEHIRFFESLMNACAEGKVQVYMAEINNLPAGVLIISGNEVNIMVSDLHRRKGVAKSLISAAQEDNALSHLIAHVVVGNLVAAKLFVSCGFELTGGEQRSTKACITFLWKRREVANG